MSSPQLTSDVSHKETLYFQQRAASVANLTPSTATYGTNTNSFVDSSRTTRTFNVTDTEVPLIASSGDSLGLNHAGNDTTPYSQSFALAPRRGFRLNQVFLNFAFAMNVSAYTNGNPLLTTGTYQVFHWTAGSQVPLIGLRSFSTGFSALAATGAQVYVVRAMEPLSGVMISENDMLVVQVTTTTTTSGTNTRQEGVMPVFPLSAATSLRDYSVSCAIFRGTAVNP